MSVDTLLAVFRNQSSDKDLLIAKLYITKRYNEDIKTWSQRRQIKIIDMIFSIIVWETWSSETADSTLIEFERRRLKTFAGKSFSRIIYDAKSSNEDDDEKEST